jgi:antitoxin MazE
MKTRIHKWGNSLALRIPKSFAEDVGLRNESPVEVSVVKGRLVVSLVSNQPRFTLKQLLAQVTEDNRHAEIETGTPVGNETW